MKKFLGLTAVLVTASMCVSAAAGTINLSVDGKQAKFDTKLGEPYIDSNSRTMIPLRSAAYALGLSDKDVSWNDSLKAVEFNKTKSDGSSTKVTFIIGSKDYNVNDTASDGTKNSKNTKMDTAAVIKDGRTYAPIRYLAEAFGYGVSWNSGTSTISIDSKNENQSKAAEISTDNALDLLKEIFGDEDYDTGLNYVFGYDKTISFKGEKYYVYNLYELEGETLKPTDILFVKTDGTKVWDGTYDNVSKKYTMNVYDDGGNENKVVSD